MARIFLRSMCSVVFEELATAGSYSTGAADVLQEVRVRQVLERSGSGRIFEIEEVQAADVVGQRGALHGSPVALSRVKR